jgi:hypothetical protein
MNVSLNVSEEQAAYMFHLLNSIDEKTFHAAVHHTREEGKEVDFRDHQRCVMALANADASVHGGWN